MPDDLTAIEKRPKSWRLNLANAKVVYENKEAKGVITDFKVDDPTDPAGTIHSLVKVQIEGYGESDYIPLWFCPKKLYWDTNDHEAQDFNQEGMYYENAWMSFRGGDEVKVLMQDDEPKAVMGFIDNLPLVGESYIKLTINDCDGGNRRTLYIPFTAASDQATDGKGPDGISLNLKTEVDRLIETSNLVHNEQSYTPEDPIHTQGWTSFTGGRGKYTEWLIELGGLAYIVQVLTSVLTITFVTGTYAGVEPQPDGRIIYSHDYHTGTSFEEMKMSAVVGPNNKELIDNINNIIPSFNYDSLVNNFSTKHYMVEYPGFVLAPVSSVLPSLVYPLNQSRNDSTGYGFADGNSIKIYQSPHTKEELQAADLWPWPA